MKTKCLVAVAVKIALASAAAFAAEHTKDSLTTVRKNLKQQRAVLIDVREKDEWNRGHLKEATHVALSVLRKAAEKGDGPTTLEAPLPKKKIIYCHCRSGGRALVAGGILKKWGYDVRPLSSGFDDLVEAGFPQAK